VRRRSRLPRHSVTKKSVFMWQKVRGEGEAHHEKRGPRWYDGVTIVDIFCAGAGKADGNDCIKAEDFADKSRDV